VKIREMATLFRAKFPQIALHSDTDPDDWDVRRGDQTIVEKR